MSGKRHHILPRFLLKGFANKKQGEQVLTWVYHKGKKPYKNNIINVSVEKHFYGKEGEIDADTEITNVEYKYSVLIDELRNRTYSGKVVEVETNLIPDFIAHLSIRTKHLRDSINESTAFVLSEIENNLFEYTNFSNFKKHLLNKLKAEKPNTLLQLLLSEGSNFLDNRDLELKKLFLTYIDTVKGKVSEVIRETHIKTLSESPNPKIRADMYQGLRWFICSSKIPLILGDTGCLFEINGSRRFKSFHDKLDKIKYVFLPITSNKILIGSHSELSEISFQIINEAIAKSSRKFFICSEYSEYYNSLLPLIGQESELIKKDELKAIVNKNFNNF
ncbi:DUF4238 domain-containing protein [Calothrix sp. FACHB-1219]|uniref:DUF4238 domain-containing protein n=1 Tax=unclassified Calothrix TaxID=2619626 RepID=UPI001684EFEA|nr:MULTISPECIES: DUF4238 domain-containing protein [unclassified Calothrix]MBD2207823.1 DUF4238 domain-containing protein [Calothrix sp. FACHB-168]MBD2222441.1 DUF4238 domain-containing protein [Calothrix sp. FACHB-1219]